MKYYWIVGITTLFIILLFIYITVFSQKAVEDKCPWITTAESYLKAEYLPNVKGTYNWQEPTGPCLDSGCTIRDCKITWKIQNMTLEITDYLRTMRDVSWAKRYMFINGTFENISDLSEIPFLKDNLFSINKSEEISRLNSNGKLIYTDKGKIYIFKDFIALVSYCESAGSTCCPLDCP